MAKVSNRISKSIRARCETEYFINSTKGEAIKRKKRRNFKSANQRPYKLKIGKLSFSRFIFATLIMSNSCRINAYTFQQDLPHDILLLTGTVLQQT